MAIAERPRWRVNSQSFIGHALVSEGAEVFYTPGPEGHVSDNLSPLNDVAQEIVDSQKREHPDKTANAAKKAKAKADAIAKQKAEDEEADAGLVKAPAGDTRKPRTPKAAKGAPKEAEADAGDAGEGDDGDVA